MNALIISKELDGIDESKAAQISAVFSPMVEMLEGFEAAYASVMKMEQSTEKAAEARRLRIDISKIRISADKARKEQKAEYLRAGNAIQGVYNILKYAVEEKEAALSDIEKYEEIQAAKEKARLQSQREADLLPFEVDGSNTDLGSMPDDIWLNFLAGSKANYEARIEAERKAEEDRLAAIEREKEERKKLEAAKRKAEMERSAAIKAAKIEAKRAAKAAAELKAEKDRAAKIEAERVEAERKQIQIDKAREAAKIAAEKAAAAAPDNEKLKGLADALLSRIETLNTDKAKNAIKSASKVLYEAAV